MDQDGWWPDDGEKAVEGDEGTGGHTYYKRDREQREERGQATLPDGNSVEIIKSFPVEGKVCFKSGGKPPFLTVTVLRSSNRFRLKVE
jgi:hypothetical protein